MKFLFPKQVSSHEKFIKDFTRFMEKYRFKMFVLCDSSQVSVYDGTKGSCSKISTSGVDGNLIIWDIKV